MVSFIYMPYSHAKPKNHDKNRQSFSTSSWVYSLIPRLSCGEGKIARYTLFAHALSSLGNLHTTPLHQNYGQFCLPAEMPHCIVILPLRLIGTVINNIASTVTVCIPSFEVIGELQRERLQQSWAAAFSWNGQTCGQFLQVKS